MVHVGDVTSLAIGKQHEQPTTATRHTNTATPSTNRSQSNERANGNHIPSNSDKAHHDGAADIGALVDDATAVKTVIWPSPRHRVCLPTAKQQRRASLVYFAYPPPELSVDSISQALHEWWYRHNTTTTMNDTSKTAVLSSTLPQPAAVADAHWIPYQDYYLLRNQAASSAETGNKSSSKSSISINASQRQFERIASIPLRTVLTEKWNQVQRGAS